MNSNEKLLQHTETVPENTRIDGFVIKKPIAKGTFSTIYEARSNDQHSVAIKILLGKQYAKNNDEYRYHRTQIQKEIDIGSQLDHPHVLSAHAHGIFGEDPYIVYPFVSGDTLAKIHPIGEVLTKDTICQYTRTIAEALGACHDRGIIHRDLKPSNLLRSHSGHLFLSDFGLAIDTKAPSIDMGDGSSHYVAPEQLQKHTCFASDQYALAAHVFLWMTGEYLFHAEDRIKTQQLHISEPVRPRLETIKSDVLPVLEQALAKDPKQRFSDIRDFAQAVEASIGSDRD